MSETYRAIALCALGLEKVLSAELERIGLSPQGRSPGRVYFDADEAGLYRANLRLRTAERILLEAARFQAPDFDALFERSRGPAWERFFDRDDRLVIERVRSRDSTLSAQTSIQSVVHKAIYERLGRFYRLERLPESGRVRSLRVYLEGDECILGLDLSGEALHRRGYRRATGDAPLKETVAAGLLLMAGYRRNLPLLDPFCGSGTILIEAALFALDRAPGLERHFDLESMPLARAGAAAAFSAERESALAAVRTEPEPFLVGSDADPRALEQARANAERAGVASFIEFRRGSAEEVAPIASKGILLCNPPYGERLGTEAEAEALYRRLGERFGAPAGSSVAAPGGFEGWGLGFVTNRPDFGEFFGRRAPVEHCVTNGAEEQWFHWYPAGWELRPLRQARPPEEEKRPRKAPRSEGGAPPEAAGFDRDGPRRDSEWRGDFRRDGQRRSGPPRTDERRTGERRDGFRRDGLRQDGEGRSGPRRDDERRTDERRGGFRREGFPRQDERREGYNRPQRDEGRPYRGGPRSGSQPREGEASGGPRRDGERRDGERRPNERRSGERRGNFHRDEERRTGGQPPAGRRDEGPRAGPGRGDRPRSDRPRNDRPSGDSDRSQPGPDGARRYPLTRGYPGGSRGKGPRSSGPRGPGGKPPRD